jgi:ApbE superfamily uncharacterized protein (UPF0280 family)
MVACQDAALADAYATAFCNRVHGEMTSLRWRGRRKNCIL